MSSKHSGPTPLRRLIGLLHPERRTINYIFLYAIAIGLFSMCIPIGITAVFNLLANGAMYSSTYILIFVVVVGVALAGILLIGQLSLVEFLEQKLFLKNAVEFAYRLPRIKRSELKGERLSELVNRFFDVIILQKSILKLLVDMVAAVVTIFFSVVLLSFYHPVFVVFGVVVLIILAIVVLLYYNRGVRTSIQESEHKYETVAYLEEVAINIEDYRGDKEKMDEVIEETDELTSKYLKARNDHFSVLKRYFTASVIIRTLLFGAMLLLGSFFVVERQMTFGQFVASEVVIVQIAYSVEKLLTGLDTIFDMLTGAVKLSVVTDLELVEEGEEHE